MQEETKQFKQCAANGKRTRFGRWTAVCACALVLVLAVPALLAMAKPIEGTVTQGGATFTYKVEEGEATITHIAKADGNTAETYEAVIPESIAVDGKSYLVVSLADNVMGTKYVKGKDSDTADEMTTDSALTRVVLPSKLLSVGNQAFAECLALTSVEFAVDEDGAQHLESVGDYAFYNSAAVDLQLPDTLTSVGQQAFSRMDGLRALKLPATSTEWGLSAFEYTLHVQQLSIPEGAVTVPRITCDSTSVDIPATVEGEVNITAKSATQVNVSPSANINALNLQFASCDKLTVPDTVMELGLSGACPQVTFPKNLRIITRYGVTGNSSLEIPATVETIASMAFQHNVSLQTITFEQGSKLTEISSYAFSGCSKLEKILLPEGLQKLDFSAFNSCGSLTNLVVPASVSETNHYVQNSGALESIVFSTGSQMRTISRIAKDCDSLNKIVLPAGIQTVNRGSSVLVVGCKALEQVIVCNPDLQLQESDFKDCGNFKVYGWATEGNVLDFAESTGHEFVPFAELDTSGRNGAANVEITLNTDKKPQVVAKLSSTKGYDYSRVLTDGIDYSSMQVTEGNVTCWQIKGNNETSFGTALIAASQDIGDAQIASIATQLYDGTPCQPKPTVTLGGRTLSEGADYVLSYANNAQPGTATVTATGVGGYTGKVSTTFSIVSARTVTQADRTATVDSVSTAETVVIAWGWDTAAVASASAFSAVTEYPLVCVSNTGLTTAQASQLSSWGTKTAYVVGGSDECGQTVVGQLEQAGVTCQQIAGQTAAETSLSLASCTQAWGKVAVVANPEYPALTVAAGAFAGAANAPLVYTNPDGTLSAQALEALQSFNQVIVVGDQFQVDVAAQAALEQAVRISGNGDAAASLALASYAQKAGWYQVGPLYATSVAGAPAQAAWAAVAGKVKVPFVLVDLENCTDVAAWAQANAQTVQGYTLLQNEPGELDALANLLQMAY
jgi:hypothetical protein